VLPDKPKNDEKPKGRPRRPMILVALAMIAIGAFGALWSATKSQTPPPPPTLVITSYEVRSFSQQTTTITTSKTTSTITTASQINAGDPKGQSRLAQYLASLLNSLQDTLQPQPTLEATD
jgi:hypothetical protein